MAKIGCLKPFRGTGITFNNTVLEDGEIAFDTTNNRIYMGDGTNSISNLAPYINAGNTDISNIGDGSITGAINTINSNYEELNSTTYTMSTGTDSSMTLYKYGKIVLVRFDGISEPTTGDYIIPNEYKSKYPMQLYAYGIVILVTGTTIVVIGHTNAGYHFYGYPGCYICV